MRLKRSHHAYAVFAVATSNLHTALADPLDPLGYSDLQAFLPINIKDITCPANYFSCEDKGAAFEDTCCENGQKCSLDAQSSAACCPATATCTGVAPDQNTATATYVSNAYFTFPVVPTSYSNVGACSVALNDCNTNYRACVSDLEGIGGGYGVTIQVPGGGGTTVAPAVTSFPSATATSMCSTLSLSACHGLSGGSCAQGTHGAIVVGNENVASRPMAASAAAVIAGVGLALVGALN
ncbi:hypothetical protein F5Y18DRAFT_167733 [Xylariaceae sp. FL1019]|nr:hypothetical protein F5Y18DRAFT_167733 [Xylariaceae sp. FL1019]